MSCLKKMAVKNQLEPLCNEETLNVMREAAMTDYRLDYKLAKECLNEIGDLCREAANDKKLDCLKVGFQSGWIDKKSTCYGEVRRSVVEGAADVFVDSELFVKCKDDLNRFCKHIPIGAANRKSG